MLSQDRTRSYPFWHNQVSADLFLEAAAHRSLADSQILHQQICRKASKQCEYVKLIRRGVQGGRYRYLASGGG